MMQGESLSLETLAGKIGAELRGGDPATRIDHTATLENAQSGALSFLSNRKYRHHLAQTRASAVILAPEDVADCPTAALVADQPYIAYARASRLLYPDPPVIGGIHPSAVVDASAKVDGSAWIGPLSVVEAGARIGPGAFIGPGCIIGRDSVVEADCRLMARVTVMTGVYIGQRARIQPGAVIGSDGFGFAREAGRWLRIPQLGGVRIGDDVEVGANATIDRGALDDTLIGDGVILDNLIQIAHNVQIGEATAIAACSGVSGSTKVGRDCIFAGMVGVAGHLEIEDGVTLAAGSKVNKSLQGPGAYGGVLPVEAEPGWRRNVMRVRHLDEMAKRLNRLEKRLEKLLKDT